MARLHALLLSAWLPAPLASAAASVLLIAGPASHGPGLHEHPAGCALLAKHLETSGLGIRAEVVTGWPDDPAKVAEADSVVIYCDGLDDHIAAGHLAELRSRHEAGKGLAVLHFALEPQDAAMARLFDDALGGRFEVGWSVNPVWLLSGPILAEHPATRGVEPFELEGEFYYHLRLREDAVPLLQAHPPLDSLGDDGPRSGNPAVRGELANGVPQTLAWVVENPTGSRGFGFTGGHFHRNWSHEDFRQLVLNAIAWTAGVEVPAGGVVGRVAATPAYQTIDEAIARGDLDDVKLHLELDPGGLRGDGRPNARPPLEQAILRKKTGIAVVLIEAGADPNSVNSSGRTPLHLAVDRNDPLVVAALLAAGAKPDRLDDSGWTPLHHAAAKNQLETARALLDGGADPMTLSELGGTPLHEAAASGGADLVRLLLARDVDPAVRSKEGVTALDLAKKYKNQAAIEVLEQAGR